ncbi:alpha-L-fucosidase [Sphingobacterium spiritivorum]|uniref:alpha-L-fucosidase n=1 Tax=Sphingobacterium spiritivorum TaxID=258 RepID=UPI00191A304E|nr:alpha-L-fucosidase [Sphingobacterium spiritivorum]QQT25687.1 alpha-L-fucosidase [Sphingobacterium spiritivorum]
MKINYIRLLTLYFSLHITLLFGQQPKMNEMWKGQAHNKEINAERGKIFKEGRYAMFIHFGYYSHLGNKWDGKTYYGIGEWMMNENMANLTPEQYKSRVKEFNPTSFNADSIASLAKAAGMKYIIITSKHHDGFAMFHARSTKFNIVDATPYKRDIMKELSLACQKAGLGFGFYYSQYQDWTTPGGNGGPDKYENGQAATFDDYFNKRCLPDIQQITTEYGALALVWFDTPGGIEKKYVDKLVEVVHHNQPKALVSGRVGHGLGDYSTLGDMEVPKKNVDGLWESVDVTNDSWGYAWYDNNWKTPKQILINTLSTVARGGNYMLNIGLGPKGEVLPQPREALVSSGNWIKNYPQIVYQGGRSPWDHAISWGDAITRGNTLSLLVYNWPSTGKLFVPHLNNKINAVKLLKGQITNSLQYTVQPGFIEIDIPVASPEKLVSVIELELDSPAKGSSMLSIDPQQQTTLDALFAEVAGAEKTDEHWMEKFGEWKHVDRIKDWSADSKATWKVNVIKPGYYQVYLNYTGEGRYVWRTENTEQIVQNQQNSSNVYQWYPFGWMHFDKPGDYEISVSLIEGNFGKASLTGFKLEPVSF